MRAKIAASGRRLAASAALLLAAASPTLAQGQPGPTAAIDRQWHFAVAPYFWLAGSRRRLRQGCRRSYRPVLLRHLDSFHFGFLAHFEGGKPLGFATDIMYMDLRSPVAADAPILRQLGLEAIFKASPPRALLLPRG